jgi:dTDP-4-amino-4,6-dideoxygalactose transaminase
MEPYRSLFPQAGLLLPSTENIADRILVLPTGTAVTPADIMKICAIIRTALEHTGAIRKILAETDNDDGSRVS